MQAINYVIPSKLLITAMYNIHLVNSLTWYRVIISKLVNY